MIEARSEELFKRVDQIELQLCLKANQFCHTPVIENFFTIISRLGDGIAWYALIILLPLVYGNPAMTASLHMILVALVCLTVYKTLKSRMVRHRPYTSHDGIRLGTAPLDPGSFPSGHTLHAVAFSIVACSYYPELAWLLVPFSSLIALSRVILGLHYPSDVLAGATIGSLLAALSLYF
jgi:undecaprenyl-diphosphatase